MRLKQDVGRISINFHVFIYALSFFCQLFQLEKKFLFPLEHPETPLSELLFLSYTRFVKETFIILEEKNHPGSLPAVNKYRLICLEKSMERDILPTFFSFSFLINCFVV